MTQTGPEKASLLGRVASGEAGAFSELVERYGHVVAAVARRGGLSDVRDVEDAAQETFLSVWRSAGRFDPACGNDVAFVATIARRRTVDARRSRPTQLSPLEEADEVAITSSPERDTDGRIAMSLVQALSDPRQRKVLLSALSGFTHEEIADELGVPLGTVKSLYIRSIVLLRRALAA